MTRRAFIKPARQGLVVRDPLTGALLPAKGARVPMNTHWRRQLNSGDVVLATRKRRPKSTSENDT